MNYAIIDLGSNTIRLSVYSYENGKIAKLLSKKEIAGLAGYVSNGFLEGAGIKKACEILNSFKLSALKFVEPPNIHLFATASLRNIENREEAVKIITGETALVPDVLEGTEEAALGFAGVSQSLSCENGIMLDIGGASTELVLFKDYLPAKLISLPIGCLNLSIQYVNEIVPTKKGQKKIREVILGQFAEIDWEKDGACPLMVGIGGTLRGVLKLSRTLFDIPSQQYSISARHVKDITKRLKNNNGNIHHTIYKTVPERVLTLPTGLAILQQVINKFECEIIAVSRYGIREGYLADRVLNNNEKYDID